MGRLDDIVKRNQKALRQDGLLMKGIGTVVNHGDVPAPTDQAFQLPSQRKPSIARWKIAVAALVVLLFVILTAVVWTPR